MAAMAKKLMVEVVEARDLLPKDGMGTSSPYVVVDFDGQRRRTQTVHRDLNPTWNEALEFDLIGSGGAPNLGGELLEVDVMHDRRVGPSRRNNFLGRVRLDSRQFVKQGEEALIHFPLEKKSFFSWVRGDIGLKIYYVDQPVPAPEPTPPPEAEKPVELAAPPPAENSTLAPPAEGVKDAPKPEEPAGPPADTTIEPPAEQPPLPDVTAETEASQPPLESGPNAEKPAEPEPTLAGGAGNTDATEDQPPDPGSTPPVESAPQNPPPPSLETEKEAISRWVHRPEARPIPRRAPDGPPEVIERSSYDLVDKMQYLFVRVVRARSLPGDAWPRVRVSAIGRHVGTGTARRVAFFFEWDQTFAFSRDPSVSDSSNLEISVWDLPPTSDVAAQGAEEHFLGGVCFDVSEVPMRDPSESTLAPQWYRLEGGRARGGDLMLATWVGTQADEFFRSAWKADAPARHAISGSKVYQSPKIWYLRATVLEAQDTLTPPKDSMIFVRAALGLQMLRTRHAVTRNSALAWNEDLFFVAAEPFNEDQRLVLTLENRQGKDATVLGSAFISLSTIERRVDDRKVASRWLDLVPGDETKRTRRKGGHACGGRLHVRVCLDGGYHVADEPPESSSDFRPSARQLWRQPIGTVDLGIIGCKNLLPMRAVDGKGVTDVYVVAKYGPKWARTRTVAESYDPSWNEQFMWEVYDPCTVLTIGVFDESDGSKDSTSRPMGRVRIRISTLQTNRTYRGSYPLLLMLPSGAKRMGEIELSVRFARAGSALDLLQLYARSMLPPMHHLRPLPAAQREQLRLAAARIVAAHLSCSEPSLRREVVMWMLDAAEPRGFSMRRVRANWYRIVGSLSWITDVARWVEDTRRWRNPTATMLAHGILVLLAWHPDLVAPALALHASVVGVWAYRRRPRGLAPHPCVRTSGAEGVDREELDEEFDTVPSARGAEVVRARYDRARAVGARLQAVLGDVASQAERVQALVSWRDPRATGLFVFCCFMAAVILLVVPFKMIAVALVFYYLRHPMFRDRMPPPAMNFFKRLPSLSDRIL